jgi:hypothetical protein
VYGFASFIVVAAAVEEPRPIYGIVYTVGGYGEEIFYSTWVDA